MHSHSHRHRKYNRKRKTKRNINNILKICAVVAVVVAVVFLLKFIGNYNYDSDGAAASEEEDDDDDGQISFFNGRAYRLRDDVETVLLIGIDKYMDEINVPDDSYINSLQADFDVLLIIDKTNRKYDLLQISRDTMVPVRELGLNGVVVETKIEQLALSHTYGNGGKESCRNTVKSVEQLLFGVGIDHYIAFTMDVIPEVNDAAGGVKVLIEDDFSSVDPSLVIGEEVVLNGEQALEFVRARGSMSDPTNTARMKRHRVYMDGLMDAAAKKMEANSSWAAKTVLNVWDYITSDLLSGGLSDLAELLVKYERGDILTIKGETQTREFVEFYPDEDALKAQVIDLFYKPVAQ